MKILVADDEPKIRRGLSNLIKQQNEDYLVEVAENGQQALEMLESFEPNLIYLDIKMPMMDGLSFAKEAKAKYPKLLIIIVSGYAQFDYAKEAMLVGALDYILKPIMPKKIIETLEVASKTLNAQKDEDEKASYYIKKKLLDMLLEKSQDPLRETIDKKDSYRILYGENTNVKENYQYALSKKEKESTIIRIEEQIGNPQGQISFFYKNHFISLIFDMTMRDGDIIKACHDLKLGYLKFFISKKYEASQPLYKCFKELLVEKTTLGVPTGEQREVEGISNKIMNYIHENYERKINLSDIATQVYMHSTHVSKLFKKETGMNISEYMVGYRIEVAKKLLCDSKYKIYDVAYKVGFNSPKYFINVFKMKTGMTPSDFRNKNIQ